MKYKHKRLTELFLWTRFTGEFHFFHVHNIFQNIRNEHNFAARGIFINRVFWTLFWEKCVRTIVRQWNAYRKRQEELDK